MIGVGHLLEVIWPILERNIGGPDAGSRFIGVTADAADIDRKAQVFGVEMVLDDNLDALDRNHPDLILFAPPPTVAPDLIESVLVPYFEQRRTEGGPLPVLYAFPPVPAGSAYLDALGSDVLVANIIPNNVTTIGDEPVDDEGFYVCTFPGPWPDEEVATLRTVFDGQGAFVHLEPDELIPMLGGAATVSALWFAVPAVADLVDADHNQVGRYLRAQLDPEATTTDEPPEAEILGQIIDGWRRGVERYYAETSIVDEATATLAGRGLDLTLHTIAVEPREVLTGHAVGAATKGGVLEKAIDESRRRLLPAIEARLAERAGSSAPDPAWTEVFAEAVTETCRTVRDHGMTLADQS